MLKILVKNIVLARNYLVFKKYDILAKFRKSEFPVDDDNDFVVSIASYPKRDHLLPAVFEALSYQLFKPNKWIIVLSIEDYPDKLIPRHLKKLESKGVEIVWSENNSYAVKKLVPVVEKYPQSGVVTLDDDIIYHKKLLYNLVNNKYAMNGKIVGHLGKALYRKGTEFNMMFRERKKVNINTNCDQVYLIGGGGIYYPPNSLDIKFRNKQKINEIVPGRGSDFWFWAAAISAGTQQVCIGAPEEFRFGTPIPQNQKTKPKDRPGAVILEKRFQMTIDYFGIRHKLINSLPDKNQL